MKKCLFFLLLSSLVACKQKETKPDPKSDLSATEEIIRQNINDIQSKEMLDISLSSLDSIIKKYPNTVEAKKAAYLKSKKDSLYNLIDLAKKDKQEKLTKLYLPERKGYQESLRNYFLDQGFDIKVTVSGKNYDELMLEFPLFNDVWFRKFETNGNFEEWFKIGFTKITLSNNYDYCKYKYI